jgi:hypothetical protein
MLPALVRDGNSFIDHPIRRHACMSLIVSVTTDLAFEPVQMLLKKP